MMKVHQFNVKSLEQTCFEVLKDHLCPENCIRLWQFTKNWNIPIIFKLKYEVFHFICENFEEVSLREEFLQLAVQEVLDILGQNDLTVTQESTVYESVLRWINHMPDERQGAIATLLPKVRLGLMDKSYIIDNVLNNDVIKTNPESHLLVFKTLQVMSKALLVYSEPGINNTLFCRRLPRAILLMVGLFSESIATFDYSTNSWIEVYTYHNLEDPMTHLNFYSPVFLGRYIYIVGVLRSLLPSKRVWRFNLVTHTWQEMSPMHESRAFMSVTMLKGCIYIMGGCSDNFASIKTAERYQPDINHWMSIASMNDERINANCTTLNNKIYICGGYNNYRNLNSAEYYNPNSNQWTLITPMGTPRYRLGVVAYKGHIFAIGGCDGSRYMRSAEAYDPVTNTWHDVPKMAHTHIDCGAAVINKRIYVVSRDTATIVECYDSTTNTWSVEFFGIDCEYDFMSCCVISGLPNMADNCSPREYITAHY